MQGSDPHNNPDRQQPLTKLGCNYPSPQVKLEAVLEGHLPIVDGPWFMQYAQLLAQVAGPIGVIRLDNDVANLDLVSPRLTEQSGSSSPANASSRWNLSSTHPSGNPSGGFFSILSALCTAGKEPVRHWLVRLCDPDSRPARQIETELIDWTLVCGADNIALAGAYCLIKRLFHHAGALPERHVGYMVMGADRAQAQEALWKLNLIASPLLRRRVELRGSLKQMLPPTAVQHVASTPLDDDLWPRCCESFSQLGLHDQSQRKQDCDDQGTSALDISQFTEQPGQSPASMKIQSIEPLKKQAV